MPLPILTEHTGIIVPYFPFCTRCIVGVHSSCLQHVRGRLGRFLLLLLLFLLPEPGPLLPMEPHPAAAERAEPAEADAAGHGGVLAGRGVPGARDGEHQHLGRGDIFGEKVGGTRDGVSEGHSEGFGEIRRESRSAEAEAPAKQRLSREGPREKFGENSKKSSEEFGGIVGIGSRDRVSEGFGETGSKRARFGV